MTFKEFMLKEGQRLYQAGSKAMSIRELLTFVVRDIEAAAALMQTYDNLYEMATADIADLTGVIGKQRAEQVHAAMELGIRLCNLQPRQEPIISCVQDAVQYYKDMEFLQHEELRALALNSQNRILRSYTVFKGSAQASTAAGREIFAPAIAAKATGLILFHNHPGGKTDPSANDKGVTKAMAQAGKVLDIRLLDHIIIARNSYYSFANDGSPLLKTY